MASQGLLSRPAGGSQLTRRQVRDYFNSVRPLLRIAVDTRQRWVGELSLLFQEARNSDEGVVIRKAGAIGRQYVTIFRDCLRQVESYSAPDPAVSCHRVLREWLDHLVKACNALLSASNARDLSQMQVCQEHLTQARLAARTFNQTQTEILRNFNLIKS